MVIRKPYAFLIKNFKKIHMILLVLSLYVVFKLFGVNSFINDFMKLGTYDVYQDPITKHITFLLLLVIVVLVIGSVSLLFLLRHKKKPWKIYLIPIIEYLLLFFVLLMIRSFFGGYSNEIETTDLRLSRDLLFMFMTAQIPAIIVFVIRVFGVDINKFQFNLDEEFLELSEDDREEVEISLHFDKNSFIRFFKKTFRHLSYFYVEHKRICNILVGIVGILLLYQVGHFIFITNKSYSEGDFYSANGYTIKVNESYFTNKDYAGNVISNNSNFVVVNVTLKNKSSARTIKLDNFHLKSGISDFTTTEKTFAKEFQDLGSTYESVKELKKDEMATFIIVFKVDKNIKKDSFVLYYQEKGGILRKIKLNLKDISKIEDKGTIELGEEIQFNIQNKKQVFSLDSYAFLKTADYTIRNCNTTECYVEKENYTAGEGYKVLKIDFASNNFEGKEMVDFSSEYGKIVYIDNSKMEQFVEFKYPIQKKALGKYLYTLIPEEVEQATSISIVYTIRNEKYTYKLK